jgi:hypothetical protein
MTDMIAPWPVTEAGRREFERSVRAMLGHTVQGARYLFPASSDHIERRHFAGFDEVDMGVELLTAAGGVFSVFWHMEGFNEGLAVARGTPAPLADRHVTGLTVSDTVEWRRIRGSPVTAVGLAWHVPNENCPEAVWALRLMLGDALSLVIALGEAHEVRQITYMPDSLVVIFDEAVARNYHIPASVQSSWGGLV